MSVFSGPEIINDGLVYHLDAYNYKNFAGSIITKNYVAFTPSYQTWDPSPTYTQDIKSYYISSEIQRLYTNNGRSFLAIWWSGFNPGASEVQYGRKFSYSAYVRGQGSTYLSVHQATNIPNNVSQSGYDGEAITLNTTSWQRITLTGYYTSSGVTSQNILISLSAGIDNYVDVKNVQFEYQDSPTTYVNGSRLSIPDLSNNNNITTFSPTPYYTTNTLGINGVFSGTTPNNSISGITDNSTEFTISGWVKYDSNTAYSAWFEKQTQTGSFPPRLDLGYIASSNKIFFTGWDNSLNAKTEYSIDYIISTNTWTNIVLSCKTGSLFGYVNGIQVFSGSGTMNFPDAKNPVGIGGYTRKLNGSIGSILIYNKQLTENQVMQNYQATRSRYGV